VRFGQVIRYGKSVRIVQQHEAGSPSIQGNSNLKNAGIMVTRITIDIYVEAPIVRVLVFFKGG
jgi:hypothetical protein